MMYGVGEGGRSGVCVSVHINGYVNFLVILVSVCSSVCNVSFFSFPLNFLNIFFQIFLPPIPFADYLFFHFLYYFGSYFKETIRIKISETKFKN